VAGEGPSAQNGAGRTAPGSSTPGRRPFPAQNFRICRDDVRSFSVDGSANGTRPDVQGDHVQLVCAGAGSVHFRGLGCAQYAEVGEVKPQVKAALGARSAGPCRGQVPNSMGNRADQQKHVDNGVGQYLVAATASVAASGETEQKRTCGRRGVNLWRDRRAWLTERRVTVLVYAQRSVRELPCPRGLSGHAQKQWRRPIRSIDRICLMCVHPITTVGVGLKCSWSFSPAAAPPQVTGIVLYDPVRRRRPDTAIVRETDPPAASAGGNTYR
jgi:hypothetical protein